MDTPADMLQGTQSLHQRLLSLDIVLKNLCLVGHWKLPQDKPEEDFLVNKLRTPGLLCEENLHCIHVLSCEWERRSLLQNFPVLTSPARLSDKWQCDHSAESRIFLLRFSDLIKIEVSLLVHVFIGQPSLEGGKTHPLGEIPRSNLKKTHP